MSLEADLYYSVSFNAMLADYNSGRISQLVFQQRVRRLFTAESCQHDELCKEAVAAHCSECEVTLCAKHIRCGSVSNKALCEDCERVIVDDLERYYPNDMGDGIRRAPGEN